MVLPNQDASHAQKENMHVHSNMTPIYIVCATVVSRSPIRLTFPDLLLVLQGISPLFTFNASRCLFCNVSSLLMWQSQWGVCVAWGRGEGGSRGVLVWGLVHGPSPLYLGHKMVIILKFSWASGMVVVVDPNECRTVLLHRVPDFRSVFHYLS